MDIAIIFIYFLYVVALFLFVFWMLVYKDYNMEEKVGKLESYPTVTIAVPAWNEEKNIENTLLSLIRLHYPKEKLEIIVVNDGSTDRTKEIVERFIKDHSQYNIKLIDQKNQGKAAGMNNAMRASTSEFFVVMDADSYIMRDGLLKLLPYFEDPKVGVVMPLMKITHVKTFLQKIQWIEYIINYFYKRLMTMIDTVHVAPGPFSIYKKEALMKVGGFDEKSITEDLEVTLRMQKANYRVLQTGTAKVFTSTPKTWKQFYRQRNRWYKGSFFSILKHRDMLFNRKYGDFGYIQAPIIFLNGFLALGSTIFVLYNYVIKPMIDFFINFASINFDVGLLFYKLNVSGFSVLSVNYFGLFMGFALFVLAFMMAYLSMYYTNERFFKQGFFRFIVYLLLYSFIIGFVWLGVFFDLIRGKTQKW